MIYPLIAFILSTALSDDIRPLWMWGGIALFTAAVIALGALSWLRYVYRLETNAMHVEYGLFIRKRLTVPRDRVQSVDTSAGIVQRLFGVQKLVIETAGSRKPEVVLNAVTVAEAERIRAAMVKGASDAGAPESGPSQDGADSPPHEPGAGGAAAGTDERTISPGAVYRVPFGRILLYSATSGRIFLSLVIIMALYSQAEDWLWNLGLFDAIAAEALTPSGAADWMLLAAAAFVIIWLLGTAVITAKEFGFTIERHGGKLLIRRGLLERKQFTVALERIQAIHVHQNLLRRLFGCASVSLVTYASIKKDGQIHSLLCPLVPMRELPELLESFTSEAGWPESFYRPGLEALTGYIAFPIAVASIAAVPGLIWIPGGYGWTALALPAVALLFGFLRHRQAGWHLRDDRIVVRFGGFSLQYGLIPRRRIQWYRLRVSPLQARRKLATLQVITASSGFAATWQIRHIPQAKAEELLARLRGRHVPPDPGEDAMSADRSG
jgi:putative membrane protein